MAIEIKAADVMKLRKMTGAGMMDCKKALIEAEGDYDRAQDIIREKGKLVVAKRADRSASEGVVVTKIAGEKGYILCLACETDFVAQNSEFAGHRANAILEIAAAADAADTAALLAVKNAEGHTVEEMVTEKSGQTGEKVELAYYARVEAPVHQRLRSLQQETRYDARFQQTGIGGGRSHNRNAGYRNGTYLD